MNYKKITQDAHSAKFFERFNAFEIFEFCGIMHTAEIQRNDAQSLLNGIKKAFGLSAKETQEFKEIIVKNS